MDSVSPAVLPSRLIPAAVGCTLGQPATTDQAHHYIRRLEIFRAMIGGAG
jgi:hypothetical protein